MTGKQTSSLLQHKYSKFYSRTDTKIYIAGAKNSLIENFVYYTKLYLSFSPYIIYLSNPAPLSY